MVAYTALRILEHLLEVAKTWSRDTLPVSHRSISLSRSQFFCNNPDSSKAIGKRGPGGFDTHSVMYLESILILLGRDVLLHYSVYNIIIGPLPQATTEGKKES